MNTKNPKKRPTGLGKRLKLEKNVLAVYLCRYSGSITVASVDDTNLVTEAQNASLYRLFNYLSQIVSTMFNAVAQLIYFTQVRAMLASLRNRI